ncbi:MAG: homocitrate synthase [Candidatus Methanomethylophilaceae archaeon]|jgi:homocitrate synthase NifV|nr:homocitrate synthase [Candidatus Methanomethylophilaceae archaeon]NCA73600.1 homocitrate synthase [Gammaproteobacteria bacterium]MDD2936207.1 homocitrate synthase [Candidatus Methanomethylophilaceae archaeon]MDD3351455.1 homocitrate synthase [Candidatus Methanomethylophilaceae archaeon]MDD3986537.1 homocitrate synthase [Candidatus Methanomethylophilaceae archaeon]
MRTKEDITQALSGRLNVCDTTLRDGEQTAGIVFSNLEKYKIAQMLDRAGVQQIEAGIPTMGTDEKMAVRHIAHMGLNASILGWNRADINDINTSIDCGVDSVAISMSASDIHIDHKLKKDRQWVLDKVYEAVSYAKGHGFYISCNGEDSTRADIDFLVEFVKTAKEAGADRFRYCDTIGREQPFSTYERIHRIISETGMDVEMHMHDDFGMATANCLAGIHAGARFASTTVMGIGERSGNSPLEEVVMSSKHLFGIDSGIDTKQLRNLSIFVSKASGRPIEVAKPFLGSNCFAHEAGIHADGIIKDAINYEPYDPEEVGLERKLVIGKHSGRNTLITVLAEMGVNIDKDMASALLDIVRRASVQMHRSISHEELFSLYEDMLKKANIFDDSAA